MNYQKIYDDICKRGQERQLPKEVYTEKHHIVPKCMDGTNEKGNLTVLTAREHFLVHLILARKLYPNNPKLWYALHRMMYSRSSNCDRYIPTSRIYEIIRVEINNASCGENNGFYGKRHTSETKRKISELLKGRFTGEKSPRFGKKASKELRIQMSISKLGTMMGADNPFYGKKHTEETKAIIREKRKLQTFTPESNQKRSETLSGEGNAFYGKTHTNEAIEKMRNNKPNLKKCSIDGIIYTSIADATRKLNMSERQISYRLHSPDDKWKDWIFINKTEEK